MPRKDTTLTATTFRTTGVWVDAAGRIWAACHDSSTAVRINPKAGPMVVTTNPVPGTTNTVAVTNRVGLVDMVVNLGNGSAYPQPYNIPAAPYNYSDMTGFNERVVNPSFQPFKGYWMVINDSGNAGQLWNKVSWNAGGPTNGWSIEVYVRAADERTDLSSAVFVPVTNNVSFLAIRGRYIEVRLGMIRDDPAKEPVLYDLTLYGLSSALVGDYLLEDEGVYETWDFDFAVSLTGAEPLIYQWWVMPPWTTQFMLAPNATGPELLFTNLDLWDDGTMVALSVSNAAGETVSSGPVELSVWPLSMMIPRSGSIGPAQRYPATVNVRGQPTNGLSHVEVTLHNLRHACPADLDILLVSPAGAKIMLMSHAGGSIVVSNATLVFHPSWQGYPVPPEFEPIPSDATTHYSIVNYGDPATQLPGAPPEPYGETLDILPATDSNPNRVWSLYIYDHKIGGTGVLQDSWSLEFYCP